MSRVLPLLALTTAQQLNLQPCDNSTAPWASLKWLYVSSQFVLADTELCATFQSNTTNLVMAACDASPLQTFVLDAAGTISNPSTGQCWDSQYYGNTSGSGLGLYTCYPSQQWDLFAFDNATGLLHYKAAPALCVSGGFTPPPLPTAQQIAFMDTEISLMISYDLITQLTEVPNPQHFCINAGGDSGFPVPSPQRFNPSNDTFTDSWMEAARAASAGYTLLVASHCSGFLQWQSNVTLPDGTPYPYTAAQATLWKEGKGDVVADYVASSKAAGLPFGFYLTWNYNYLFNKGDGDPPRPPSAPGQINISTADYYTVMTATLAEVWERYKGDIFELWFDGGASNAPLSALIHEYQPSAIVTCGDAGPNYARLVGSESGFAPYPVWSTNTRPIDSGSGNPTGAFFVPAEADTPVATKDAWFWKPSQTYRPLDELKAVYRNTVGANSVLELGVLPDNTGSIPSDQMALLQALGDYVRACHIPAAAVAATSGRTNVGQSLTLTLNASTTIDRVILQEDLTFGELVWAFFVEVSPPGGYEKNWITVADGTAIGHKRILYFDSGPIPVSALRVTATALYPGATYAVWRNFAAFEPCAQE